MTNVCREYLKRVREKAKKLLQSMPSPYEHVCGSGGFGKSIHDRCPACEREREEQRRKLIGEPEVILKLEHRGDRLVIVATDANGLARYDGHLLEFLPSGRIRRCTGVNPILGFDLDTLGRIKEA